MNKERDDARVCNNIPRGQHPTFLVKKYKVAVGNSTKVRTAEL